MTHTAFSMRRQHARMAHDPTVVWCISSRESLVPTDIRINFCQKLESLNYTTAATVLVYLYLLLRYCFRNQEKMFRTSVNSRPHCPLTSFFSWEPDRISEQALHCQKLESLPKIVTADSICVYLCSFSRNCFFFQNCTVSASKTDAKTEFDAK